MEVFLTFRMLLKKITLENIRSYTKRTIEFPEGSIILSGDIGCGKSSILLAVEFALFGTSRPDLPGELLLRKGTINGSVELDLIIDKKEVKIKRNLKKEKETIKQLSGYLIVDNVKKELMPSELKAEVFSLLGYPEDLISKNKNYLFRYTIYTPQEEMKFVLQENPDVRLDTLRKIFNIDKYKNVRDNLQFFLKNLRQQITILKTKTEPLEKEIEKYEEINKEKEELEKILLKIMPNIDSMQLKIKEIREQILSLEKEKVEFNKKEQEYKSLQLIIKSKMDLLLNEEQKKEKLSLLISDFPLPKLIEKSQIEEEVQTLELKKEKIIATRSSLQEQISQLQKKISTQQEEMHNLSEKLSFFPEKEKKIKELFEVIGTKSNLQEKKEQLNNLFQKTSEIYTKNLTILNQSKELNQKISSLNNCPLCLQEVSHLHKEKILNQEQSKIIQSENLLLESNKNKSEILQQKKQVEEKIEEIILKENLLTRLKIECAQLEEKKLFLKDKKEELPELVKKNNQLMNELETNSAEINFEKDLKEKRSLLEKILRKELLDKQLQDSLILQEKLNKDIRDIQFKIEEVESWLTKQEDPQKRVDISREILQGEMDKEKELSLQRVELSTNVQNLKRNGQNVKIVIDRLKKEKNQLIKYKNYNQWFDKFFINLTFAIEKQIMVNIHRLFNQLFQEWFSILIDDDQIYARIDNSFSPVIEQNGYDIAFNNLSGGEKTSASLAYRLALNRVINDVIHQIKTKEILILDEPTDGFSTEQLDKVRDVLDKLNLRQTIIVSHESKIESFVDNVIRISKEGHMSYVV